MTWKNRDSYALLAGLAIAGTHFVITVILNPLGEKFPPHQFSPFSTRDLFLIALIAPGAIPIAILHLPTAELFFYGFSSLFYGTTAGLLTTNRKTLRWIGIIFIAWRILSNFIVWLIT